MYYLFAVYLLFGDLYLYSVICMTVLGKSVCKILNWYLQIIFVFLHFLAVFDAKNTAF